MSVTAPGEVDCPSSVVLFVNIGVGQPKRTKTRIAAAVATANFFIIAAIIQRLLSIQFGGSRSIEREPKASIAKPRDARIDSGARQLALQVC